VFQGATQINLDAKGRMSVPTKARDPLTQGGTVRLVLTAHPEGCLLLYPLPAWEPIRAKVMAFPSLDRQSNLWKRLLVGFAEDVEPDGAGRLLISPVLRDYAHIKRQVMFVGPGQPFRNLGPRGVERGTREPEDWRRAERASRMENFSCEHGGKKPLQPFPRERGNPCPGPSRRKCLCPPHP
jgi:MraZ protein